jgi:uncharacterized membrane protein
MSDLLALAYADEYRGAEVLAALRRLRTAAFDEVVDAVSVVRRTDWTVLLSREVDLSMTDDCCLRYWRGLVASLIVAPGVASLRSKTLEYGVDSKFERRLAGVLPPGSSAVLLIVAPAASASISTTLNAFGGTLCQTTIARVCTHEHARAGADA